MKQLHETLKKCIYQQSIEYEDTVDFVCNLCGKKFLDIEEIMLHLVTYHINDKIPKHRLSTIKGFILK
jgi:hypothetical protein